VGLNTGFSRERRSKVGNAGGGGGGGGATPEVHIPDGGGGGAGEGAAEGGVEEETEEVRGAPQMRQTAAPSAARFPQTWHLTEGTGPDASFYT
jgi:hypothetical protein